MSTKKLARTPASTKPATTATLAPAAPSAAEVESRRARLRLFLPPVLNLLRAYLRDVSAHVETTIEQLEGLEAFAAGGELPAECADLREIGELAGRVYVQPNNSIAEEKRLGALIDGPVLLCETTLAELCWQAFGEAPSTLSEAATKIASALRHSDPNHEATTEDFVSWRDGFEADAAAHGFAIGVDNIGNERADAVVFGGERKAQVGHG